MNTKQHGVVFDAPLCREHGEPMQLSRFAVYDGPNVRISYAWFCPHDSVEESCQVIDPTVDVPAEVLAVYGDPSPHCIR